MRMSSPEKIEEVSKYYFEHGEEKTLSAFKIKPDSVRRYLSEYRKTIGKEEYDKYLALSRIKHQYSLDELKTLADGKGFYSPFITPHRLKLETNKIKFGVVGDSHIGSVYFIPNWWDEMIEKMKSENVDFICHVGDVTEGMNSRPGHVYELSHIGYDKQKAESILQLGKWEKKWYLISGNHDLWHHLSVGADIVKDISGYINADYLGMHEGDLHINNIKIKLWHGSDGSSYATSYRLQKIVESLSGGSKPNILLAGHVHKSVYLPQERNIECISAGCLSMQSRWMRTKRLPAHAGYWIIDLEYTKQGITAFNPTWYPFYVI